MNSLLKLTLAGVVTIAGMVVLAEPVDAQTFRRQYYSNWTYQPARQYHYRRYFYTPSVQLRTYQYHYVINYPRQPRYAYYYNPRRQVYWGRFEMDEKGKPVGYSLLKPADRKGSLKDIPESAFPEPGDMPPIPDSEDGVAIEPPPRDLPTPNDLPQAENS